MDALFMETREMKRANNVPRVDNAVQWRAVYAPIFRRGR